jgi:hypothetical protein
VNAERFYSMPKKCFYQMDIQNRHTQNHIALYEEQQEPYANNTVNDITSVMVNQITQLMEA